MNRAVAVGHIASRGAHLNRCRRSLPPQAAGVPAQSPLFPQIPPRLPTFPPSECPTTAADGSANSSIKRKTSPERTSQPIRPATCGERPWLRRSTDTTRRAGTKSGRVTRDRYVLAAPRRPCRSTTGGRGVPLAGAGVLAGRSVWARRMGAAAAGAHVAAFGVAVAAIGATDALAVADLGVGADVSIGADAATRRPAVEAMPPGTAAAAAAAAAAVAAARRGAAQRESMVTKRGKGGAAGSHAAGELNLTPVRGETQPSGEWGKAVAPAATVTRLLTTRWQWPRGGGGSCTRMATRQFGGMATDHPSAAQTTAHAKDCLSVVNRGA